LRRGETYRYGIVLYDDKGNKWPVIHIGDITTPPQHTSPPVHTANNVNQASILGIKFSIRNLPSVFTNFEIVRCIRTMNDRRAITQGIVGKTMYGTNYTDVYFQPWFITLGTVYADFDDFSTTFVLPNNPFGNGYKITNENSTLYQFASPEVSYNDWYVKNLMDLYNNYSIHIIGKYPIKKFTTSGGNYATNSYGTIFEYDTNQDQKIRIRGEI
jgi:hypothetical protein